jgi:hypothetical protein
MASLVEPTASIAQRIQNPLNFIDNTSELNVKHRELLDEEYALYDMGDVKVVISFRKLNPSRIRHYNGSFSNVEKVPPGRSVTGEGIMELKRTNTIIDHYLRLAYHDLQPKV